MQTLCCTSEMKLLGNRDECDEIANFHASLPERIKTHIILILE